MSETEKKIQAAAENFYIVGAIYRALVLQADCLKLNKKEQWENFLTPFLGEDKKEKAHVQSLLRYILTGKDRVPPNAVIAAILGASEVKTRLRNALALLLPIFSTSSLKDELGVD